MSPQTTDTAARPQAEPHGWLGTETLKTHAGDFAFKNGYPAGDTAERLSRSADAQSRDRGLPDAVDAGERDRLARRPAGVRRDQADAGGDLGKPDGRQDDPADRQYRDRLRHQPSRTRKRWSDGGRGAAAHAGLPPGRTAALPRRHRTARSGQGPGRKVPGVAAGLRGQRARRLFRRRARRPTR